MATYERAFISDINSSLKGKALTVLSYNVLASSSAIPKSYPYCKPEHLKFNIRGPKMISEIKTYDPDIICLQEVDNYKEFWYPKLNELGYSGNMILKVGKSDGCATFYKRDLYYVYQEEEINFNDAAKESKDKKLQTGNVGLITVLQSLEDSDMPPILVSNCHLYWDPK
eukprot:TRINITY_DN9733_c0_g2_i4.p1 TRINITY_DN9733_c0_g2~~TRINITY_DN9733_c0_g2_i4.p1  ORF type:complete len:179 (+),score=25.20 TRINITY_DN9733_c0_g2_i4:32-538(+)